MITPETWAKLKSWMNGLGILEEQIDEQFIIGSGRGGQKIQKTSSCVRLSYLSGQIVIKCQESRSREMNRFLARRRLCEKIDCIQNREKSAKKKQQEKIRRQKARRSRKAKEKMLENKRHQAKRKLGRRKPGVDDG
jgi:peptide chain release factor